MEARHFVHTNCLNRLITPRIPRDVYGTIFIRKCVCVRMSLAVLHIYFGIRFRFNIYLFISSNSFESTLFCYLFWIWCSFSSLFFDSIFGSRNVDTIKTESTTNYNLKQRKKNSHCKHKRLLRANCWVRSAHKLFDSHDQILTFENRYHRRTKFAYTKKQQDFIIFRR